ncbi:MAG: hypothetical protein OQL19_02955 [Gammaproteobacteria bacterium]|nr:hypothetical protein [Gammaproteobacteria bacterium]
MRNTIKILKKRTTKKVNIISLIFLFLLPIVSHAESATTAKVSETVSATIVQFSESEQGTGSRPVTMIVTDQFMRIDDSIEADGSSQENGFVLFDRKEKVIYSVSAEEQQIVTVKFVPVTVPSPIELKLDWVTLETDKNAPLIGGKKTQQHQLFVNEKLCYYLVSVPELMPDVVAAIGDFNQVLAGQQAETLRFIPADLHDGCDLAKHTFYPKKHLSHGFPLMIQAMDESGKDNVKYSRDLVNFKQQMVSTDLFVLPNYSIVPIN